MKRKVYDGILILGYTPPRSVPQLHHWRLTQAVVDEEYGRALNSAGQTLRAQVVSVRTMRPGDRAGYGLDFQAERESRLATVSIGYADGLPRKLSQRGSRVLINGRFCPMAGRMCMDQLLIDVTGVPDVHPGTMATLIGQDGPLIIRTEEIAEQCGTITNELLSRLGNRLGRVVHADP